MTPYPDLVVFLPGIGGSTLIHDGRTVWGGTWRAMANAVVWGGLASLEIAAEDGREELGDGVEVGTVVDDVHIIPGLWKIDAYGSFCSMLAACVGLVEGENFRRFPYDWRRDNRVSARRLMKSADGWLRVWRERSGNADARIILVAHSMGGLIARHYVECLEGWRTVRRLFTIGTPHRGSLDALGCLLNGHAKGIGPVRVDATTPLRSFASVHQLLPTYPCVEGPGGMVRVSDASLNALGYEAFHPGALAAAAFHAELNASADANRAHEAYPLDYLSPVASARQPTFQSARMVGAGVELLRYIGGDDWGGDGTVPMVSAVPLGMDATAVTHVWGLHSCLTSQEGLQEHMLGALRAGRVPMDRFRSAPGTEQVRLALDDACIADVAFDLVATLDGMREQTLMATAVRSGDARQLRTTLHRSGDRYVGPITLPEGSWRVAVRGTRVEGAEDVILALRSDGSASSDATAA